VASKICRAVSAGLAWGAVAVGAPASTKRFFCVNTGPRDMEVEFTPWIDPDPAAGNGGGERQGLTLAHFSAQPEPFLTLKTSPKRLKPLNPRHEYPLNIPLNIPCPPKNAYVELKGGRV